MELQSWMEPSYVCDEESGDNLAHLFHLLDYYDFNRTNFIVITLENAAHCFPENFRNLAGCTAPASDLHQRPARRGFFPFDSPVAGLWIIHWRLSGVPFRFGSGRYARGCV